MEITPQIFTAKVMHKRIFPKVNSFTYSIYYLALPLSMLVGGLPLREIMKRRENANFRKNADDFFQNLPYNRFGILSFHDKDHGAKDGKNLYKWIRKILKRYELSESIDEIILVAMPRVIGYVFNPVSFWLCLDKEKNLKAVLCEVNNTFGETHSYFCAHKDGSPITEKDTLEAKKIFHVSPFLKREGFYKFRFDMQEKKLSIWIDYYNLEGEKQLITSLIGGLQPLTKDNLLKVFFKHPLVTFKTIFLIHWQAIKLISKGIKYISKPRKI